MPPQKTQPTPPPAREKRRFARVFMDGHSQAVRLPRGYRFDTDRVGIRREGCNVILSPIYEGWEDFFENAPPVSSDFVEAMSSTRPNLMPIEHRESLD